MLKQVNLDDQTNLNSNITFKQEIIQDLNELGLDSNPETRANVVNSLKNKYNVSFDTNSKKIIESIATNHKPYKKTSEYNVYQNTLLKAEIKKQKQKFTKTDLPKTILTPQLEVPLEVKRLIADAELKFNEVFENEYEDFSIDLANESEPKYAYGTWGDKNRRMFQKQLEPKLIDVLTNLNDKVAEFQENSKNEKINRDKKGADLLEEDFNNSKNSIGEGGLSSLTDLKDLLGLKKDKQVNFMSLLRKKDSKGKVIDGSLHQILVNLYNETPVQKTNLSDTFLPFIDYSTFTGWYEDKIKDTQKGKQRRDKTQEIWKYCKLLIIREQVSKIENSSFNNTQKEKKIKALMEYYKKRKLVLN